MTMTISPRRSVVIAANPAAVQLALGDIGRVGIEMQERPGGVEQLKVYAPVRAQSVIAELGLTKRLVEVLELIAEGLSRREIGARLYLSDLTVKAHAARLYRRLGVDGRETAVAAGFRLGILGGA